MAVVIDVVVIVSELLSKFCFNPSNALFPPPLLLALVTVDDGVDFFDELLSFELDPVFGDDFGDDEPFGDIEPNGDASNEDIIGSIVDNIANCCGVSEE